MENLEKFVESKKFTAVRLGIITLLFIILLWKIDISKVLSEVMSIPLFFLLGALGTSFLALICQGFFWKVLIGRRANLPIGKSIKGRTSIIFVNQLIPARSGRLVAPSLLARISDNLSLSEAGGVVVADTFLYAICYGVASLVGLLSTYSFFPFWISIVLIGAILIYFFLAGLIILTCKRNEWVGKITEEIGNLASKLPLLSGLKGKGKDFISNMAGDITEILSSKKSIILYVTFWFLSVCILRAVRFWLLFLGVGYPSINPLLLLFVPIMAYSVTIFPVSIGGIGISEGSAVLVLSMLGVPASIAITVVFLERIIGVYIPAILGGLSLTRT